MDAHLGPPGGGSSDYGSDLSPEEEEALIELLSQVPVQAEAASSFQLDDIEDNKSPRGAVLPHRLTRERWDEVLYTTGAILETEQKGTTALEIGGDKSRAQVVESSESRSARQPSVLAESRDTPEPERPDLRSPLERFRTKPKKALSVTDLVSPSWCELQYWYVLTKHGRKRRTPAMRQGSAVHKTLEDQVHRTVPIDIRTKEDAWGLRIWNVIQGLKTLRETGMTRELEIWGLVDGQVVNGVVDELSYVCPDKDLEEETTLRTTNGKETTSADQPTISDFFMSPNGQGGVLKTLRSMRKKTDKIYLTDVKTRSVKTIPKGASFRPTLMQLMLYHLMLSDLVTGKVDPTVLFTRYELNTTAPFSDGFIAQIAALDKGYYDTPDSPSQPTCPPASDPTQDPMTLLLAHNSLTALWTLFLSELRLTFPSGAGSIGNILKVEYRDQTDGSITGLKAFLYDQDVISEYVEDEMRWWKGNREARGVEVEEAYKCRSCDFAEGCEWRINKVEEAIKAVREREAMKGRAKSVV
ncbi:hypothetical protein MMC30_002104 [Trapelia coarctata]|nr:hypothetical protein [Trapelia coarctata]